MKSIITLLMQLADSNGIVEISVMRINKKSQLNWDFLFIGAGA